MSDVVNIDWVCKIGWFMVFNATFNNILVISWRSVLLEEETRLPGDNHRPFAGHCQTLSQNVVSGTSKRTYDKDNYTWFHVLLFSLTCFQLQRYSIYLKLLSWSWSYGSWIYKYLYNQRLSPLKLWVWTPLMARCTRYNMMW